MNFVGNAARRTDQGLRQAAGVLGCDVAALHADIQVEAGTSGFDSLKRPKMLFEPHLFYRNIRRASRNAAVAQGLAYLKWGTRPYPKDSYPRLAAAMRLDPEAALRSASWGLPQILGSNHLASGYATPGEMVQAFVSKGEDEHLMAMARFIGSNPAMHRALVSHDWSAFARLYNGSASRGYDTKLADAYRHILVISPEEANRQVMVSQTKAKGVAKTTQSAATAAVAVAIPAVAVISQSHAAHQAWPWLLGGIGAALAAVDGFAAKSWFNKRSLAEAEPHPLPVQGALLEPALTGEHFTVTDAALVLQEPAQTTLPASTPTKAL